jgi:hypothetical protein
VDAARTDKLRAMAEGLVIAHERTVAMLGAAESDGPMEAAVEVCRAWLADNPADSDLPVTEPWLKSLGFYPSGDGPLWLDKDDGFTLSVRLGCDNIRWLYCGPVSAGGESVALPDQPTRGHVRRLLAALDFTPEAAR